LLQTFRGHESWVYQAAFSPDGQQVVTASADKTAKLWAVSSGQLLQTFQGHKNSVYQAAFSPNGQQVVTASFDNTAKLWAVSSGQLLHTFQGHESWVYQAAFSPDGQKLVTDSTDGTVKLWDVNLQNWIDFARQSIPRRLSTQQRQQFFLPELPEQVRSEKLIEEGNQLAQQGKVTEAIAKFTEAKKEDSYLQFDSVMKARILAMPQLLKEGRQLAKKGNISAATAKFQQATEWGYQFGIQPAEQAQQIAAMKIGRERARQGDIPAAVVQFQQAVKFGMQIDPEMKAKQLAATALREQSNQWLEENKIVEAIIAQVIAQQIMPDLNISDLNLFYQTKSLAAGINKIIYLCEQAAEPAEENGLGLDWNSYVLWAIVDWQFVVNGMANVPNEDVQCH
jgi:tetratricopeptide (TPR) repeat protein